MSISSPSSARGSERGHLSRRRCGRECAQSSRAPPGVDRNADGRNHASPDAQPWRRAPRAGAVEPSDHRISPSTTVPVGASPSARATPADAAWSGWMYAENRVTPALPEPVPHGERRLPGVAPSLVGHGDDPGELGGGPGHRRLDGADRLAGVAAAEHPVEPHLAAVGGAPADLPGVPGRAVRPRSPARPPVKVCSRSVVERPARPRARGRPAAARGPGGRCAAARSWPRLSRGVGRRQRRRRRASSSPSSRASRRHSSLLDAAGSARRG